MPRVYQIVCLSELGNAFKFYGRENLTLKELFKDTHAEQIVIFRPTAPSAASPCGGNLRHAGHGSVGTAKLKLRENGKEAPVDNWEERRRSGKAY